MLSTCRKNEKQMEGGKGDFQHTLEWIKLATSTLRKSCLVLSTQVWKENSNAQSIARKDEDYCRKFEKIGKTISKLGEKIF